MIEPTTATDDALAARAELEEFAVSMSYARREDFMFNPGLFIRSSLLVKFLVMDDLYRRILSVPGALVEFGCWYGQNLVLLENLRAIHEPFNKSRELIGLDSFAGYEDGSYSAGPYYYGQLKGLLRAHERCNAFGHLKGDQTLISGDVTQTAPAYFNGYKGMIALAMFDIGLYAPTKAALTAILPHLQPGSVLLMDELSGDEAQAFKAVFGGVVDYAIEKVALYPSKTIVTVK